MKGLPWAGSLKSRCRLASRYPPFCVITQRSVLGVHRTLLRSRPHPFLTSYPWAHFLLCKVAMAAPASHSSCENEDQCFTTPPPSSQLTTVLLTLRKWERATRMPCTRTPTSPHAPLGSASLPLGSRPCPWLPNCMAVSNSSPSSPAWPLFLYPESFPSREKHGAASVTEKTTLHSAPGSCPVSLLLEEDPLGKDAQTPWLHPVLKPLQSGSGPHWPPLTSRCQNRGPKASTATP